MPRENRKYSPEFKIEVIETKLKENLSQSETARRFNLYITIHDYIFYYNNKRIKSKLKGLSPVEFRTQSYSYI